MHTNKVLAAISIKTNTTPAKVAAPKPGPRVFTTTEILFTALAGMMASGLVPQKADANGVKSKTFLAVTSWRINSALDKLTGKEGFKSKGRGGKGPVRWIDAVEGAPLSGYYLKLAEDYLAVYGSVLETPMGKSFVANAKKSLEAITKAA
jgi:hypothetical protein